MVNTSYHPTIAYRWKSNIAKQVITICLLLFTCLRSFSQHEYLSVFDYNNLTLSRVNNIPGVTWVAIDNTTYDENGQRFFFKGNATGTRPFQLFTLSAQSGNILFNPVCPSNNPAGQVLGLQYDAVVDTLYGLYNDGNGSFFFSWIDPATGVAHPLRVLPSFTNYIESSFDSRNRRYICHQGKELLVIDAASGNILFRNAFPAAVNVGNLVYDNTRARLYATCYSSLWEAPQFDSISVSSGAIHFIAELPTMSFPQLNANAIDEDNGRFIFVGKDPVATGCFNNYLYKVDLRDGDVLAKTLYPFAQNTGSPYNENALGFSYDQKNNRLYVLNWYPPAATHTRAIVIASDSEKPCPGAPVVIKATPWRGAVDPAYRWQVNGHDVGEDAPVLQLYEISAGDVVRCIMTNRSPCAAGGPDTSNSVTIQFAAPELFTVQISAAANPVCVGSKATFTAQCSVAGDFTYQWQVNGRTAGANSNLFEPDNLADQDVVLCRVTAGSPCLQPNHAVSNSIVVRMQANVARLTITSDRTAICEGQTVHFSADGTNAGNSPQYRWEVNGVPVGQNSRFFSAADLKDADVVRCVLMSSNPCSAPVFSVNSIQMKVNKIPVLSVSRDTLIAPGQKVNLTAASSEPVAQYNWSPAWGLDNTEIRNPVASPDKTVTYTVRVTSEGGCTVTGTVNIGVRRLLSIPTAFSPNKDGKNDVFSIPVNGLQRMIDLSIFNRYGQKVFSTNDAAKGWDGTLEGVSQPAGSYVWVLAYVSDFDNRQIVLKGLVTLIK